MFLLFEPLLWFQPGLRDLVNDRMVSSTEAADQATTLLGVQFWYKYIAEITSNPGISKYSLDASRVVEGWEIPKSGRAIGLSDKLKQDHDQSRDEEEERTGESLGTIKQQRS